MDCGKKVRLQAPEHRTQTFDGVRTRREGICTPVSQVAVGKKLLTARVDSCFQTLKDLIWLVSKFSDRIVGHSDRSGTRNKLVLFSNYGGTTRIANLNTSGAGFAIDVYASSERLTC